VGQVSNQRPGLVGGLLAAENRKAVRQQEKSPRLSEVQIWSARPFPIKTGPVRQLLICFYFFLIGGGPFFLGKGVASSVEAENPILKGQFARENLDRDKPDR
jgi:hypothetical protein